MTISKLSVLHLVLFLMRWLISSYDEFLSVCLLLDSGFLPIYVYGFMVLTFINLTQLWGFDSIKKLTRTHMDIKEHLYIDILHNVVIKEHLYIEHCNFSNTIIVNFLIVWSLFSLLISLILWSLLACLQSLQWLNSSFRMDKRKGN